MIPKRNLSILEGSKEWAKLIKDIDDNMRKLKKNKEISADTLMSLKDLERKLSDAIKKSDMTIDAEKKYRKELRN